MANFFSPKRTGETISLTFDFKKVLATGETISSAVWTVEVEEGTDASPSAMKSGSSTIDSTSKKITQLITGGVDGNTYKMIAQATTSASQIIEGVALLEISDARNI